LCLSCGMKSLTYEEMNKLSSPFYCHYWCKDDRPIYVVAPGHYEHQKRFLEAIGLVDDVTKYVRADVYDTHETGNPYGLGGCKIPHKRELREKIERIMRDKTAYDWEHILGKARVPCAVHLSTPEWLVSAHAQKTGLVSWEDDRARLGPMCWMEDVRPSSVGAAHLTLDRPHDHCLHNVKVIDLCNVIAGPTIGMMLSRMGADVMKIDTPTPLYNPVITIIYGMCANRGKTSVLLDVYAERDKLHELFRTADIVTCNTTYEGLERLGLTEEALYELNPNLVLVHFDAWGGPIRASDCKTEFIGYDDNVQAGIGIMERFGGGMDKVEEHAHIGTIDTIAGVSGACSAVAALINLYSKRLRSVGRASLASTGQLLQLPMSVGTKQDVFDRWRTCRNGIDVLGEHTLHRSYKTLNGKWVMIVVSMVSQDDACFDVGLYERLRRVFRDRRMPIPVTEEYLQEKMARESADYWVGAFLSADLVATVLMSLEDLKAKYTRNATLADQDEPPHDSVRFFSYTDHPIGEFIIAESAPIRFKYRKLARIAHSPKYGIDQRMVGETRAEYSSAYLPYLNSCSRCRMGANALSSLPCGSHLCNACLSSFTEGCVLTCPSCQEVHFLQKSMNEWKDNYRAWRNGESRGSHQFVTMSTLSTKRGKSVIS
jgi:crotonobetainyl-CoA:carnitine CoA-transferase CaiB-like acyl-CoA transferase